MHRPPDLLLRFTRAERWVHRATAVLALACLATAACLYLAPLAELVGRRRLVVTAHVWCGLALPVPLLLGLGFRAVRADVSRLSRFGPADRAWLRAVRARAFRRPAGKFNAGQKLYAQWTLGTMLVLLGTGLLMWLTHLAPPSWRTGATFVHDWLAAAVAVVSAGHIRMALRDPEARRGMRTGWVDRRWAEREHPHWAPAPAADPAPATDPEPAADRGHPARGGPAPRP
ncbi:cytochrome b/b6 domain-containing protein [Kitasatospora sp. NPDC059599]|uniref:cytochrome b/b6 domain-containing protein n=1 Tax=Kitasatospora sp. NPDC059599 TaxID=3346880 RepID=UPI0036B8493B